MIETKEAKLTSLIEQAIEQATFRDREQIISITEQIDQIDPIHFFYAAKHLNKNRTFWSNHTRDFFIVGIGHALEMTATHRRFESIEEQWQQLLDEAIIYNPYPAIGTGLLTFGGMSFDPKKEKHSLWKKFAPMKMVVPEWTLVHHDGNCFLTATIAVNQSDRAEDIAQVLDHQKELLLSVKKIEESAPRIVDKQEIAPKQWLSSVQKAIEYIQANKAKKIVMAREMRLQLDRPAPIAYLLQQLLATQDNSYIFAFEEGDNCFLGATPERLIKIEDHQLLSTCMAGTAPRGTTKTEDEQLANELLKDEKNLEEHLYVVEMIRGILEQYCTNIQIPEHPIVYPLKNLQHLYTPVIANLNEDARIFKIIEELHPTPALGGVPRDESLRFIREHELLDRGWYGAPIGWLDSQRNGEFAVAIRSGLIQHDQASLFAGCGIMKDSDPAKEYEETAIKFLPMLSVFGGNHAGE